MMEEEDAVNDSVREKRNGGTEEKLMEWVYMRLMR